MKIITIEDIQILQRYSPDLKYLTWEMDESKEWEYVLYCALENLLR